MTVAEAIRRAAGRLAATSETARLDAEWLMAHALQTNRSDMLLHRMGHSAPAGFAGLVDRRAAHEPLAYITGYTEFFGHRFSVDRRVLIPRSDSETVVEAALERVGEESTGRVLDLGTGSGALLLTVLAERPGMEGIGLDASEAALQVARDNAGRLDCSARARFAIRDWRERQWAADLGTFDIVLCNPPYVETQAVLDPDVREYEPHEALFAGPDGLDDYRRVIPALASLLAARGAAVLEIGSRQGAAVARLGKGAGFLVEIRKDLAGRPRAAILE